MALFKIEDYPVEPPGGDEHGGLPQHLKCRGEWQPRLHHFETGAERVTMECQCCFRRNPQRMYGRKRAMAEFKLTAIDIEFLPHTNQAAQDRHNRLISQHWERRRQERKAERLNKSSPWWNWYSGYLASPQWSARRLAVLTRDGGKCRGCGKPATQIHHLTYYNVGREPLEDLVAACDRCHEAVHARAA